MNIDPTIEPLANASVTVEEHVPITFIKPTLSERVAKIQELADSLSNNCQTFQEWEAQGDCTDEAYFDIMADLSSLDALYQSL